jgi:photosystem II stability/assembly factor-like uncharacterized protein
MPRVLLCLLLLSLGVGFLRGEAACRPRPERRTFAAVFLVRGSVSGSHTGSFGVFTRNGDDTTWTLRNLSSVITFGLGYFERGATRRYYIAAGNGVHRSTDGGSSWRILTSWETMEILSLATDPEDSAVVYAATPWGVYKTTDDGANWVLKDRGCKRWFVQKLLRDQDQREILYAVMEDDLYRTTDGGENWAGLSIGASQPQVVAQRPGDPGTLCVGVEDGGVRISRDSGKTWWESGGLRGTTIYALRFSRDGTTLFAAGWKTGLWQSTDVGHSWSLLWDDPAVEAIFDVSEDPQDPGHLLVGTDGQGIWESPDGGRSWRRAGLMGAKVKQIEFYP